VLCVESLRTLSRACFGSGAQGAPLQTRRIRSTGLGRKRTSKATFSRENFYVRIGIFAVVLWFLNKRSLLNTVYKKKGGLIGGFGRVFRILAHCVIPYRT